MSVSAITVQSKQVERLEAEKAELIEAVKRSCDALAIIVDPVSFGATSVINAWAQAYTAESFGRSLLKRLEP